VGDGASDVGQGGFDADGDRWDTKLEAHSGLELVLDGAAKGYWGGNHLIADLEAVPGVGDAEEIDGGIVVLGDRPGLGEHGIWGIWVNTPYKIFDIAAVP